MKLLVIQKKSSIGSTQKQKDNLRSLRLKKIGDFIEIDSQDSSLIGRLKIVKHLVSVKEK